MNYKVLFAIFALAFASTAQATDCIELAKSAVACYEAGSLADSYDEEGKPCGSDNESVWTIAPSKNSSISVALQSSEKYSYPGGHATKSICNVSFENDKDESCEFEIEADLGTEDASVFIFDFACQYH